ELLPRAVEYLLDGTVDRRGAARQRLVASAPDGLLEGVVKNVEGQGRADRRIAVRLEGDRLAGRVQGQLESLREPEGHVGAWADHQREIGRQLDGSGFPSERRARLQLKCEGDGLAPPNAEHGPDGDLSLEAPDGARYGVQDGREPSFDVALAHRHAESAGVDEA